MLSAGCGTCRLRETAVAAMSHGMWVVSPLSQPPSLKSSSCGRDFLFNVDEVRVIPKAIRVCGPLPTAVGVSRTTMA